MQRAILLVLFLLAAALVAEAQPSGKVYRIGVLASGDTAGVQTFRQALRDLGYIEGRNLVIEAGYDKGNAEALPALAAELVRFKVDVILAASSTYVRAAKQATTTTPIVFAVHNDPVGTGDVASLAHPGGNITGTTQMATDLSAKQLDLLRETVLGISRVGVLWNPTTPSHGPALKQIEAAARTLGVQLTRLAAAHESELDRVFATAARDRIEAVFVLNSPMTARHRERVVGLAMKHRLPTMYAARTFVEVGGLLAYDADQLDLYRRAANYVDRILKGAKPANLPIEQPTKFELVVNLKTAKALGLSVPPSLLAQATEVIE
jgi:putative ABC transport system substrate-binding protein